MTAPSTLRGKCPQCGAVRYEVADDFFSLRAELPLLELPPRDRAVAFKPFAGIARAALTVTHGADRLMIYGSKENHDAHCARCGSMLYSLVRDAAWVHITLGTLIDPPTIRPSAHIFVGSKAPWFTITDDLPQYDGHVTG